MPMLNSRDYPYLGKISNKLTLVAMNLWMPAPDFPMCPHLTLTQAERR